MSTSYSKELEYQIAKKKEEILELARKLGTSEDGWDYVHDCAAAGAELVDLEKKKQ
jgi:hypothetical protein